MSAERAVRVVRADAFDPQHEITALPASRVRLLTYVVETSLEPADALAVALELGTHELDVGHLLRGFPVART
ncbi:MULTISPECIES: hypothetical protein [unclassified Streptomyces]|uniref:hypothetical protein n=1 Tax=unclassified Streptomyces TaxID=2593676 RepID=UPI003423B311